MEALCTRWARQQRFLRLEGTLEWPDGTLDMRFAFVHALYHQVLYERIGALRPRPAKRERASAPGFE